MPRPSKATQERFDAILAAIRDGLSREVAAQAAGISPATLYEWQNRLPEFSEAIKRADAEAERSAVVAIRQAGATQWQALAWWLERRHPERWAKRDPAAQEQLERARKDGRAAALRELREEVGRLTPDARRLVMDALAEVTRKEGSREPAA